MDDVQKGLAGFIPQFFLIAVGLLVLFGILVGLARLVAWVPRAVGLIGGKKMKNNLGMISLALFVLLAVGFNNTVQAYNA